MNVPRAKSLELAAESPLRPLSSQSSSSSSAPSLSSLSSSSTSWNTRLTLTARPAASPDPRQRDRDLDPSTEHPLVDCTNALARSEHRQWVTDRRNDLSRIDVSNTAGGKKRTSSRLSPHPSTPAGPPPAKKFHSSPRSSRRARSANSHRRTSNEEGLRGPLFFSSERQPRRPPLPYRMSSSEAAARMMGKGGKEDGGGVKTLKLARGSASVTSPSRPPGLRTPSGGSIGGGRSFLTTSKPRTSDERHQSQEALDVLTQSGIIELIDQDDRPTFVLDMTDRVLFEPGPLRMVYANASLRAVSSVLDTISGASSLGSPGFIVSTMFSDFKAWTTGHVRDHEPLDVSMPTFSFAGAVWTCSILRKRYRVFRGVPVSPRAGASMGSNPQSFGLPSGSSAGKDTEMVNSGRSDEVQVDNIIEPQDYFGSGGAHATRVVALKTKAEDENNNGEEHGGALKISNLTNPLDLPPPSSSESDSLSSLSARIKIPRRHDLSPKHTRPVSEHFSMFPEVDLGFFDWTRMADSPALPRHIRFARNIDWASTSLGPIDGWSSELRSMCNLIMASPHPAAMYWGPDFIAIYNEAYIYLAGQKHPDLMGQSYRVAWAEIWDNVKDVFDIAIKRGESTMKEDDCLFIQRAMTDSSLEEAWFDWSIIPLVGGDGSVVGLYNPAFEKTKRKVSERRTGTLSSIGERTSTAKDLKTFWKQVMAGLQSNEFDVPFALLYSVADEMDSDSQSSVPVGNAPPARLCLLEGNIGIPDGHPAAAEQIDLRDESYFAQVFRDAALGDRPIVLSIDKGTLDPEMLEGIELRGHPEPCSSAICCPVQSTRNETLGFLVMGVNPRRPYDDDYNTFIQMLSRQISTAMASVVLFEEEIRAGMKAKRRADIARRELSEQLAVQTQAAVETERKFTQMARFAPVGIFIADSNGVITYRNEKWYEILKSPHDEDETHHWIDAIHDDDIPRVKRLWSALVNDGTPMNTEVRFKSSWVDQNGNQGDTWVLASGYPEKDDDGRVKVIFGSITDISQQKWAEHFEKRRMEEAVEMKRQQENFIDITSHEMRNPLSAILQCADEISTSLSNFNASGASMQALEELTQGAIDAAGVIALCAQHQKRIVDDILTLSKLDSALLLVTPCDVMPITVVQRALKMFDGEVQTADIRLKFTIDDSIQELGIDWVKLDPSRVLQVLINLTTNAIKFTTTQEKRMINVNLAASLERPSRDGIVSYFPARSKRKDLTKSPEWGDGQEIFLHFRVEDTGRGLTDDEKKLLFMRFSQASPRTHVQYGGSGLGLFISRELVELQGGEIGVASKSGEGSTFAFYVKARRATVPDEDMTDFPAAGPRKVSSGHKSSPVSFKSPTKPVGPNRTFTQPSPAKTLPPSSLKVLVVEDNLVNQKVLARQLKNMGITVHLANHGGECIDRLKESTFWKRNGQVPDDKTRIEIDAILMDQEMPVMDGLTCTRAIREMEKKGDVVAHVPVIAVTANARSEQIDTALNIGMDDVVSKPFRIPDLIPKIEELITRYPAPPP